MPRIVYLTVGRPNVTGGQKTIVRHVEALLGLGYDARIAAAGGAQSSPLLRSLPQSFFVQARRDDDIIVVPEDNPEVLRKVVDGKNRIVIFVQSHLYAAGFGLLHLPPAILTRCHDIMTTSYSAGVAIASYLPDAAVSVVSACADERAFFVEGDKEKCIAVTPMKREFEYKIIKRLFETLYRDQSEWSWRELREAPEMAVAATFKRSAIFLGLGRFESLGITALEAMAAGCIVAGYAGNGTMEYATPVNGYWAVDDDCEAAARALISAAEVFSKGGSEYLLRRESGLRTAQHWTYDRSVYELDQFWSKRA